MAFCVYVLASLRNGTLYIGHTDTISRRTWEHRSGETPGFTAKYRVRRIVHNESSETREAAFGRERAVKKWRRLRQLELIERFNPGWRDLYDALPLEWGASPAPIGAAFEAH